MFLEMISHYAHRLKEEAWTFRDIAQYGQTVVSSDKLIELYHDHCLGYSVKDGCKRRTTPPVQFEILRNVFIGSSWTILGDANQLVNPCIKMDGFENLSRVFAGRQPVILKLSTSYRASHELTEFTKHMSVIPDATYATAREGKKPVIAISETAADMVENIADDMETLTSEGCESVAVICKSAAEAADAFDKLQGLCDIALVTSTDGSFRTGIVVMPVYLAKGLEFDAVIVYDAGRHNYSDHSEQEMLYTACTRALHRLHIHCSGEPSPLLPIEHCELYELG